MALTESLTTFVADFGVSVSFSGSVAGLKGIMDLTGEHILGDGSRAIVTAKDRVVMLETAKLGTLTGSSAITVNSVSYVVRDIQPIDDGSFSMVWLR